MTEQPRTLPVEPRWPVILAALAALLLLTLLPGRIRFFPIWVPYAVGILLIIPMGAIQLGMEPLRWERVEHALTLILFIAAEFATLLTLAHMTKAMVWRSEVIGGRQLLATGIAIWVTNVFMFSILYWQIDRGGPIVRQAPSRSRPDWLFAEESASKGVPADWRPVFVDYLFLGFSTATAFSTTDTVPLTPRAKMLMMLESLISFATTVVVLSRAINILGT
jgi:uncharacterized membrane protein